MVGFNRAEVTYNQRQDANRMLNMTKFKSTEYNAYIPRRWKIRKGVIHQWKGSIEELQRELMEDQGDF